MTSRRTTAVSATAAALVLSGLAAAPGALAHGSMTDPVSRVAGCYAEGPESPDSAACKAAVAAGGTQALYDWNEVNIGDAAGRHRELIPDGRLCSAGKEKYRGFDQARADWPATPMNAGAHTFRYKATAPHRGTFALYVTKDGYDPSKPLAWSDLEAKPFATATDPGMRDGAYVFTGTVPKKSGRHLIYSIWQRSDSPEAFYTCSDVVFGKDNGGGAPAPAPGVPSEKPAQSGPGHGDQGNQDNLGNHGDHGGHTAPATTPPATTGPATAPAPDTTAPGAAAPAPAAHGSGEELAETGGDVSAGYLAAGGAAVLALGAGLLFATARRRASR
ncbi:lytic polysaccharide monooxygenase auxiliary activity family 9 protein [Streptomyces roseicoloratus]|uniref:lytic polysaccharide monooxygenase auxiliary activity family 9 protein n=1 Tax=Streptomyces roseicoloratus TaxID=2508722 RepID=UPI001009E00F|nr:lytic polysaccharide monooxygenase [Streptomyces roseicoloratus]